MNAEQNVKLICEKYMYLQLEKNLRYLFYRFETENL